MDNRRYINCCTVLPNQVVMSCELCGMTDEKHMYMTHMHQPSLGRCFKVEHSEAVFERHSLHMGDHMANSYSVSIQSSG
jgi:hypothetical protein